MFKKYLSIILLMPCIALSMHERHRGTQQHLRQLMLDTRYSEVPEELLEHLARFVTHQLTDHMVTYLKEHIRVPVTLLNTDDQAPVNAVVAHKNGIFVNTTHTNQLQVWDSNTGAKIRTIATDAQITALAVYTDTTVVSGDNDGTVSIWQVTTGNKQSMHATHAAAVTCVAVFPDNRIVSGSNDTTLAIWDATTGVLLATLVGHEGSVISVAVLPGNRIASGSEDATVRIWDATTGTLLHTLTEHADTITMLVALPDNCLATGANDKNLYVWDCDEWSIRARFSGYFEGITTGVAVPPTMLSSLPQGALAFSAEGRVDKSVRVWDYYNGVVVHKFDDIANAIVSLAAVPSNGILIGGSEEGELYLWNLAEYEALVHMVNQPNLDQVEHLIDVYNQARDDATIDVHERLATLLHSTTVPKAGATQE